MANSYYEIECRNEELELFTVRKKASGTVYYLTKREDGSWLHECKARSVYGDDFLCRHIKMVIQKYYTNKDFRYKLNISPKRTKGGESEGN